MAPRTPSPHALCAEVAKRLVPTTSAPRGSGGPRAPQEMLLFVRSCSSTRDQSCSHAYMVAPSLRQPATRNHTDVAIGTIFALPITIKSPPCRAWSPALRTGDQARHGGHAGRGMGKARTVPIATSVCLPMLIALNNNHTNSDSNCYSYNCNHNNCNYNQSKTKDCQRPSATRPRPPTPPSPHALSAEVVKRLVLTTSAPGGPGGPGG